MLCGGHLAHLHGRQEIGHQVRWNHSTTQPGAMHSRGQHAFLGVSHAPFTDGQLRRWIRYGGRRLTIARSRPWYATKRSSTIPLLVMSSI